MSTFRDDPEWQAQRRVLVAEKRHDETASSAFVRRLEAIYDMERIEVSHVAGGASA
ncbi:hypothetical protein GCM10011492_06620 [Flexivirga endophytica]|uniref:Uncharacterized protein n=1 Tax=Flexivirga endophytica TaxID=1849103 RepID=A0A916SW70_9MICO|nr:hypothetical protein [Flexivirga endophytica]GGB19467.1 hypothetical protein GCM10011492_06620 [Flexivirga endophytica]GHB36245.1 hypothetical protein GCM10008112_00990 [Flexivirga endophytica]